VVFFAPLRFVLRSLGVGLRLVSVVLLLLLLLVMRLPGAQTFFWTDFSLPQSTVGVK
jgi:hypothetical protein